jgi:two-component system LytT family response regulator
MKKITACIIDDELLARESLAEKLQEYPVIEIVGEAGRFQQAIELIRTSNPDVIFLDIQLIEGTGFDLLNLLNYSGKIIFVTAYDDFAIRAFEINALDYLLKPISSARLATAINRLVNDLAEEEPPVSGTKYLPEDRLMVEKRNIFSFIKISNIAAIRAEGDYSMIITCDAGEYLVKKTMIEWESRLPSTSFARISRNYIVNFESIEKCVKLSRNSALVYLVNSTEPLQATRSYFKKLREFNV